MSRPPSSTAPILGVLVPCRNEREVIERKLVNLACQEWPGAERPHALVVVDDGSRDGTGDLAERFLAEWFPPDCPVRARVLANDVRPGKNGALEAGLRALGAAGVDLVVLTDADVVLAAGALLALAEAFAGDARLVMACGAQRVVRDLAADGSERSARGGRLVEAGTLYDRATAWVRRLESRVGRVFSVHGQLLCWRAELGLVPREGVCADDLDLMLAARRREPEGRVALVRQAVFLEPRPAGRGSRDQAVRRARAFVQFVQLVQLVQSEERRGIGRLDRASRVQWWLYARLPLLAPELAALAAALAVAAGALALDGPGAGAALAGVVALAASPPGRGALARLSAIVRARRAERTSTLPERWEMARR